MKRANLINSKSEYTRSYSDIRGVDLGGNGSSISVRRLAYSENMYRDYEGEGGGVIESIPGFRKLFSLGKKINGIYCQKCYNTKDYIIVHAGTDLYRFAISEKDSTYAPVSIGTVNDNKSHGFSFGNCFYILDAEKIVRIDESGMYSVVGSDDAPGYVPTLYVNGSPYEQRNLLTNSFYEECLVADPYSYCYGTPELRYIITDTELKYCAVSGIDESFSGDLYIPSYTTIGDTVYQVKEINDKAFCRNTAITSVKVYEGVERIGEYAFMYATGIKSIRLPDSLIEIGTGAFSECLFLNELYIGVGLKRFGVNIFALCVALETINYSGNQNSFEQIENVSVTASREIIYNSKDTGLRVRIPLHSDVNSVKSVYIEDLEQLFDLESVGGTIKSVILILDGDWLLSGKRVKIEGTLEDYSSSFSGNGPDFLATESGKNVGGISAVTKCKIGEIFDGRIFFAGNPSLPNTVFYTQRDKTGENNPLYVGVMNYFNDGAGGYPVVSMLAVRDALAVFKSGDDGSGSIFYHIPTATGDNLIPKAYPTTYIHSGLASLGASLSFLDDPVFLAPTGIAALEQKNINYERSVGCRSHNVNFDLLKQNLKEASLTEWLGYLAVGVNGNIYLADSRATFTHETGNIEYEWFLLKNIGTYKNSTRVYRYSSYAPEGYCIHDNPESICQGAVYSESPDGKNVVFFALSNGKKYALYQTEEWEGGTYSAGTCFLGVGELLFFGTDSGDLCVFNNDKRGVPPDRIAKADDFDAGEYYSAMGRQIHPDFYTFDKHSPRYAIKTRLDDCDIPHLTKDTVKHSLVVKYKSYSGSNLHVEVGTDRSGYSEVTSFPGADLDFSELDFANLSIDSGEYFTLPIGEKEKNWVEKQITLYSDSFRSPIGIYSITYRYTIKGKIRKR